MALERLQAPSAGINTDAAPDYVGATQCVRMQNFLGALPGKIRMRGPINQGVNVLSGAVEGMQAAWSFDDIILHRTTAAATYYRTDMVGFTTADVTSSLTKKPRSSVHARYGDFVFGAIDDATTAPALGRWDGGATNLILESTAPYGFTDVHAYAHRLFVLGGTVPGTTTPVISRILYWTDADVGDLGLIGSWVDDVSGLTNQIRYDGDDTPVALATCGRSLAILGRRSINLLSGTGASNFAITNVSKEYGCVDRASIVEATGGFFFMSDRGYCYCDGTTVIEVGPQLSQIWTTVTSVKGATMLNGGYLTFAIAGLGVYLLHVPTKTWSTLTSDVFATAGSEYLVHTLSSGVLWDGKNFWKLNKVPLSQQGDSDYGDTTLGGTKTLIPADCVTRLTRLAAPSQLAMVHRILIDYAANYQNAGTTPSSAFTAVVSDGRGNVLGTYTLPGRTATNLAEVNAGRQRAVFDLEVETDTVCLELTYTASPNTSFQFHPIELYDAWVEFDPAQKRGTV